MGYTATLDLTVSVLFFAFGTPVSPELLACGIKLVAQWFKAVKST